MSEDVIKDMGFEMKDDSTDHKTTRTTSAQDEEAIRKAPRKKTIVPKQHWKLLQI